MTTPVKRQIFGSSSFTAMYGNRTVASTLTFYNLVTTYNTRYLILLFIAKSKK